MAEAGQADFVIGFWNGVLAPARAPTPMIAQLGAALLKVMADPKVQEALVRQCSVLMPLGPQPFAAYMARDTARLEGSGRDDRVSADA